jgi:hypothetical protein
MVISQPNSQILFLHAACLIIPIMFPWIEAGLWIRIDLNRIRHFAQSGSGSKLKQNFRRQFLPQILLSQIKNTGVIQFFFLQKVVSAILYLWSGNLFK